ncbi:MAG: YafY family transcriptional regulator [Cellvibrionaceae bacterium]|nr:YafY family transcriptional regulator [Cellvibrionaceae bacterium]
MSKQDRCIQLNQIFCSKRLPQSKAALAEQLECSEKTIGRYIDTLRDSWCAPLEYDNEHKGWYYELKDGETFELPGIWLTAADIQGLLMLLEMLRQYSHGELKDELEAIELRIQKLLKAQNIDSGKIKHKVRILTQGQRAIPSDALHLCFNATLGEQQLQLSYRDYQGRQSQRQVSPQRLIYYRDNWYLDAWCHKREGLRSFALARMSQLTSKREKAITVSTDKLDKHFRNGYGVFAGEAKHTAKLRFLPAIAHDIAQQQWHSGQHGHWDGDNYLLEVPYSDERELVQDVLRHCPNVVVEGPEGLREELIKRMKQGIRRQNNRVKTI